MITDDLELALIDFGHACDLYQTQTRTVGTDCYAPPEVLNNDEYCPAFVDSFCLGVSMFLIFFGTKPWADERDKCYKYEALLNDDFDYFFFGCHRGHGKPWEMLNVIWDCIEIERPYARPHINDLMSFPVFQNVTLTDAIREDICRFLPN